MSEMNSVSRFFINFGNARRSARVLRTIESGFEIPRSARFLELGAGRGGLSALLQERYSPRRLAVTDFDPRQTEAARTYLRRRLATMPPSLEIRPADALALPFEDGAFDCVFAILMLHHVEERHSDYRRRPQALREIRRVLAPGGALAYSDFSRTEEMHASLIELGFRCLFRRPRWPKGELAVFQRSA